MSFEAYKLSVAISLTENVTRGLGMIAGHLKATDVSAKKLEKTLGRIGKIAVGGTLLAGAGVLGLKAFSPMIEAASEYEKAMTRFKTLNQGDAVNAEADKFARSTKVFAVSNKELLDTLRLSVGITGGLKNAKVIAPMLAELNSANANLFGGKVDGIDEGSIRSINRFIDMRGMSDTPENYKKGLDLAQKLVTGSGGAIQFKDLEQFAKRGGTAFKGMSNDGVLMMSLAMQEMGGATAGTALMSAYQNLVAGRTTKKSMAALQDLHLATLGSVSHGTVGGKDYSTVQIKSIVGEELLRTNFPAWLQKYVSPQIENKSIGEQAQIVNNLLSMRTASNLGFTFTSQQVQSLRDFKLTKNAMGAQETIDENKKTNSAKYKDLHTKYENLMQDFGILILPMVNKGLIKLTSMLEKLGSFVTENTGLTKFVLVLLAAVSLLAIVGGGFMLIAAAVSAIILAGGAVVAATLGVVAIMAGLGVFIYAYWGDIKNFFVGLFDSMYIAARTFVGVYLSVFQAMFNAIVTGVNLLLPKALAFNKATFGDDFNAETRRYSNKGNVTVVVHADAKKMGLSVTKYQTQEADKRLGGMQGFDGTRSMRPVGAGGNW